MASNALSRHMRAAALKKADLIRKGKLPASARGGRPQKPAYCIRCGELQESTTAALNHCLGKDKK